MCNLYDTSGNCTRLRVRLRVRAMLWLRVKIHEREVLCNPGLFTVLNSYERWFVCTKHAQKGAYLAYPSPVRIMTMRHYATGGGSISCIHVKNV
jgi:hypothetical protein